MASIIKADNIQKVSDGTNIIKKCGSTTTIGSGACSPIVICGSTVTLGRCGGTVTLASGATQTGFGRTGTVDWCTTAKTAPFTGVSGKGYFVNTTCGAVTVTLPATPTAGDIISVADYASTFQTNNLTLCNNGSKLNGVCATATLSTQGQSVTLVYVDATKGWKNTMDSTSNVSGTSYIAATGGTITTCGDYKIHVFTTDGCFSVTSTGSGGACTPNVADYLVIAGGAGGGGNHGGGGGAGGWRASSGTNSGCYTAGPAPLTGCVAGITLTATTYPITVGGGGGGWTPATGNDAFPGSNSIFSSITSAGGGAGGGNTAAPVSAQAGGSGGGGKGEGTPRCWGVGNTPPVSPPQGNPGGNGAPPSTLISGGGGGASAPGSPGCNPHAGGAGISSSITGTPITKGGGGGGAGRLPYPGGAGGAGGGGAGGTGPSTGGNGTPATVNTGGGGGGAGGEGYTIGGGNGGSGYVVIRYKFQ
jgi:hypothetical protein